ncbi:hypothetical protein [Phocaeicola sp.]
MANELIKIEEFTSIIKSAPDALQKNIASIANCNKAGQAILDSIDGEGMTDELDAMAADYLKKVSVTLKNMQARRSPITQLFDKIRSVFTSDEKAIDPKDGKTIPGKITYARDQYAAKKRLEEKRRQEEAIRIANVENEKATYRSGLANALYAHYNSYFSQQSDELAKMWESLTLNSFDLKAPIIKGWSLDYPKTHFDMFTRDLPTYYLDAMTKGSIKAEVFRGKYEQYVEEYRFSMEDLRQSYIDRLISKKQELIELDALRRQNAEAAAKAEQEAKEREAQERMEREQEAARQAEEAKKKEAVQSQQATMNSLFSASAATVSSTPVKAKITEKIKVLHPNGFLEIYQKWWFEEGQSLTIEELEKIHKKMITFCEKKANKDDDRIKSKYIRYEEEVKAK